MERFFRATPWAIPSTIAVAIALTVVAGPLARRVQVHPVLVWLFGCSVGGYISVTLTPTSDADFGVGHAPDWHWSLHPSLGVLGRLDEGFGRAGWSASDVSTNWTGVILGLLAGIIGYLATVSRARPSCAADEPPPPPNR